MTKLIENSLSQLMGCKSYQLTDKSSELNYEQLLFGRLENSIKEVRQNQKRNVVVERRKV